MNEPMPIPHKYPSGEKPDFGKDHHVYGGKSALTFQESSTRAGGIPTLMVEAASALRPKVYDWKNKVSVQITMQELPVITGVFLGVIEKCEFKNHGDANNKGFSFENQGKTLFCRVFAPGAGHAVPIYPPDVFYITSMLLERIIKHHDCVKTASDAIALVRHTTGRMK